MCQANKWWIGLLPLLALWLGMNWLETERVESDLSAGADAALAQVTGEPGFSVAAGRDVSLNGWIFDESTRSAALAAAAAAPGVRMVTDGLSAPPPQNPFLWRAALDGSIVTLSGSTPSPEARVAVIAAAQAAWPQARIVDQMSYFSGAPRDFVARATGGLQVLAHLSGGAAQLRGAELTLSGKAASSAEYQAALALARRQEEGGAHVKAEILPPEAAAFGFQAESDGKVLSLSGFVGSETERAVLLAQARKLFPDLSPIDKLQVASAAPAKFAVNSACLLRALAQLKSGKAALLNNVATLSGQARPGMDAASVAGALGAAQGLTVDVKAVSAGDIAPYVMGAEKSEEALVLTGFYASDEAHEKILASAREKFSGLALTDRMQHGAGAPKSFLTAALDGLEQLARLRIGKFGLRDRAVSLRGDAVKAETAEEIKTGFIAAMPEGFSVETDLTGAARETPPREAPPPAPKILTPSAPAALDAQSCRNKMMDLVRATPIQFEFHSARIKRDSYAVLDALAEVAKKCPAASIEVAGHAVDFRRKSYNRNLSRRRAEAVASYFAEAGVDATRLTATGYGDSMPVAPNDTEEGQAKNRRIEFNVK